MSEIGFSKPSKETIAVRPPKDWRGLSIVPIFSNDGEMVTIDVGEKSYRYNIRKLNQSLSERIAEQDRVVVTYQGSKGNQQIILDFAQFTGLYSLVKDRVSTQAQQTPEVPAKPAMNSSRAWSLGNVFRGLFR